MTFFEEFVFFGVSVSLVSYGLGAALQKKSKSALCNPLLISVAVTIAVLVTARIDTRCITRGQSTSAIF